MKKILITAAALSLAAATQVGALTVTVSQLSGYNAGGVGGEFNVTPATGTGYAPTVAFGGGFETFCVAQNVGISIPGTYDASVNVSGTYISAYGNVPPGNPPTISTISLGTAYLFQQFATGVLAGYHYGATAGGVNSGRASDATILQYAIWVLQGSYNYGAGGVLNLANPFVNIAANLYGGGLAGLHAAMAANGVGGFGVGVLNLTYLAGNNYGVPVGTPAQSMLTLLPDGGTTLMLMGIGFSSLALVSRKYRA